MRIAIQGEAGSFHEIASQQFFHDKTIKIVPCASFSNVFSSLANSKADYGVVACENSLYGSIHETYDQLIISNFHIIGEVQLPIRQQLIAKPGTTLEQITEVLSHPAALDQCRDYLSENLPNAKVIEADDTAGAVAQIASNSSSNQAAIASSAAAALHQMQVIAHNIEDEPDNITRFLVIAKSPQVSQIANKASLILTTNHQPGALYRALRVFNDFGCNLTKLESRPIRGQAFRYQFIVDVLADQEQLMSATLKLQEQDCDVAVLGHYAQSQIRRPSSTAETATSDSP